MSCAESVFLWRGGGGFLSCPPLCIDRDGFPSQVGFYKDSKARFDTDSDFKERSRREVVALQSGDEVNLKAWRLLCEVSRVVRVVCHSPSSLWG